MVGKAVKLNSDIDAEDFELLNQMIETHNLSSRREGLRLWANSYRGIAQSNKGIGTFECEHLSPDGSLCSRNYPKKPEKTNNTLCGACQKAQKNKEREERKAELESLKLNDFHRYEYKFWGRVGAPFECTDPIGRVNYALKFLARKDAEIEQLRRPNEALLAEKSNLQTELQNMKNALVARIEEITLLETDNAQLRQVNEELKHDTLFEKNALLIVQLGKKEQDIIDLTSEVEKQEALINSQKQTISEMASRTSKMLREFKQYQPSTLEPYEINAYLKNLQTKIADFEGYLNTVTV